MLPRDYKKGAKYRVIKEGAYLSGMTPFSRGVHRGWQQPLNVGDVVTCEGVQWGWGSDPGQEVRFSKDGVTGVSFMTISPSEWGAMSTWPKDGYLEEVVETSTV